jgi:hypothetical protein
MRCNGNAAQESLTQKVEREFSGDVDGCLFFVMTLIFGDLHA